MIFGDIILLKLKSRFDFNYGRDLLVQVLPLSQIWNFRNWEAVNISRHSSLNALKKTAEIVINVNSTGSGIT